MPFVDRDRDAGQDRCRLRRRGTSCSCASERLDPVGVVTCVVERTRVLAASKGMQIELLVDQPDRLGCWVDGDAITFSPTGRPAW